MTARQASTPSPARTTRRTIAAVAIAAAAVAGASACSAGQITQTAEQVPAVTGSQGHIGALELHDVQIVYPSGVAAKGPQPGAPQQAALTFVIANGSAHVPDTLTGIKVQGAQVSGVDNAVIEPAQSLESDVPGGTPAQSKAANTKHINVTLTGLSKDLRPGLRTTATFMFQKSGSTTLTVPVTVRQDTPRQGSAGTSADVEPPALGQQGGH